MHLLKYSPIYEIFSLLRKYDFRSTTIMSCKWCEICQSHKKVPVIIDIFLQQAFKFADNSGSFVNCCVCWADKGRIRVHSWLLVNYLTTRQISLHKEWQRETILVNQVKQVLIIGELWTSYLGALSEISSLEWSGLTAMVLMKYMYLFIYW